MSLKTAYRTTTPFQGGLSPTTPKSTAVPLFGNTPSLEDISNGVGNSNDIHGRGSWGTGEDVDHSYREEGNDYRVDLKIKEILNKLHSKQRGKKESWVFEGTDGKEEEFDSYSSLQRFLRENKLPFNRVRMKVAQKEKIDVIGRATNATVMIKSVAKNSNTMEIGSGFNIGNGLYITCAHVIKRYNKYSQSSGEIADNDAQILLSRDGKEDMGTLIASDLGLDLAVVRSGFESEILEFELVNPLSGTEVFSVGSPRGFENNISSGIVGSNNREIFDYEGAPKFTFTDANVLPGNSGGPLIQYSNGKTIGMMSLIVGAEGLYGLNAALPSSYIVRFLKDKMLI